VDGVAIVLRENVKPSGSKLNVRSAPTGRRPIGSRDLNSPGVGPGGARPAGNSAVASDTPSGGIVVTVPSPTMPSLR